MLPTFSRCFLFNDFNRGLFHVFNIERKKLLYFDVDLMQLIAFGVFVFVI